jgi:hypothetical protein
MISPDTVASYQAGQVQQYAGAGQGATDLNSLATQLAQKLALTAPTDTAGLMEKQKETLLALKQQAEDKLGTGAALRGTAQGGALTAGIGGLESGFMGDLTGAYRDIANTAQETDFQHLLAAAGLSNTLATSQTGQAESEYSTGLTGTKEQQAELQAQAASGQSAAAYQLQRDQLAASTAQQQYQDMLSAAGLNLDTQKAQAGEGQFSTTTALQQAGLIDANTKAALDRQLAASTTNYQGQLDVNKQASAQALQYGLTQDQLDESLRQAGIQAQAQTDSAGISAGASRYSADKSYDAAVLNNTTNSNNDLVATILKLLSGG